MMPSESSHTKLTSLANATLSLLLERQRLASTHPTLHISQIVTNLRTLRSGVTALQDAVGAGRDEEDGVAVLREQYERLRSMLGDGEAGKAGLESITPPEVRPSSPLPTADMLETKPSLDPGVFEPYSDDPYDQDGILLQQRHIMDDQDARLDGLSSSIHRQHHLSLQINDELEVHTGLLDTLDTDLEGTDVRLSRARASLARVVRGAKENGSTVMIGLLILVLLVLIVVFKT